jgi:tRNA 2-thiouridine synthesizing protein C
MSRASSLLLLMRQAPYASGHPLEAVDVALVAAAFDMRVAVLFAGAGVWQLASGQDGSALGTRTQGKVLAALPHYDVTDVFVCADSLAAAGLLIEDLVLPARPLSLAEQRALIASHRLVVND